LNKPSCLAVGKLDRSSRLGRPSLAERQGDESGFAGHDLPASSRQIAELEATLRIGAGAARVAYLWRERPHLCAADGRAGIHCDDAAANDRCAGGCFTRVAGRTLHSTAGHWPHRAWRAARHSRLLSRRVYRKHQQAKRKHRRAHR
jgi:hypothetical protein